MTATSGTPRVRRAVEQLARQHTGRPGREPQASFEHGQWWVIVLPTGQSFSVVDTSNGLDLEEIDRGDE